jgi:Fe-S-cluster-containing dehydrogenase component
MSTNERYGLLIDYEFCTGCHTCEAACKTEQSLTFGQWGIRIATDGPRKLETGKWEFTYLPIPTSLCNLCAPLVAVGKFPSCVQHCQADVMVYGPVSELVQKLARKPKQVLFSR